MRDELDVLFQDVQPIEIETEERKVKDMSFWKNIALPAGVVGVVLVGMGWYHDSLSTGIDPTPAQKQADAKKQPLEVMVSLEVKALKEVKDACFPLVPAFKNEATCKLWLREYRNLETYAYSDSGLLDNRSAQEIASEAKTGTEALQKKAQEIKVGNAAGESGQ